MKITTVLPHQNKFVIDISSHFRYSSFSPSKLLDEQETKCDSDKVKSKNIAITKKQCIYRFLLTKNVFSVAPNQLSHV